MWTKMNSWVPKNGCFQLVNLDICIPTTDVKKYSIKGQFMTYNFCAIRFININPMSLNWSEILASWLNYKVS